MQTIFKLREHYKLNPPCLSYGGSEGTDCKWVTFLRYPHEEANKSLGDGMEIVWKGNFSAIQGKLPVEQYCVVTVCLDLWGNSIPMALPLHPEMEGHVVDAVIYVDMIGGIHAKVIGGATTNVTRNALLEKKY